jgi:hypothetical protein
MEIALWLSKDRPNENDDDPDAASGKTMSGTIEAQKTARSSDPCSSGQIYSLIRKDTT